MPEWRRHVDCALAGELLDPVQLAQVREELLADLDDRYHALLADGVSPAEAERAVLTQLDTAVLRAGLRRVLARQSTHVELGAPSAAGFWAATWRDIRYGVRQLRLSPSFTVAALLFLTLGNGANTALFELLDAVRMRTLPVQDPENLAAIKIVADDARTGHYRGVGELTTTLFEAIRVRQQGFADIAGWSDDRVNLSRTGTPHYGHALLAGGNLLSVLGVGMTMGRPIVPADDWRGCGTPPALVSYGFWRSEMGARPSAIGERVWINRRAFDIVGVLGSSFFGLEVGQRVDVVLPLCAQPLIQPDDAVYDNPIGWWLGAVGRLAPGWTLDRAASHIAAISPALLESTVPVRYNAAQRKGYQGMKLGAVPLATGYSRLRRTYDRSLWLLLGIAALVLLIACANLANLLLARAAGREREMAVRLALGASPGRLLRQLLAENLVLTAAGAVAGAAVAQMLSRALVPLLGGRDQQIFIDLHMDWRVIAFTGGLALVTCLLFGLSPAIQAARVPPAEATKMSGRGVVASRARTGFRRALIAAQIALSMTLVTSALLFVDTFRNLANVNRGFNDEGVVVARVDLSDLHVPADQRLVYAKRLVSAAAAIHGVESAARAGLGPVNGGQWNEEINVPLAGTRKSIAWFDEVGPGYFAVLQNRLLAGRDFTERDATGAPNVAIVSRTFAVKFFHEPAPLGKSFGVVQYGDHPDVAYQVIGVTDDLKYNDLRSEYEPIAYLPDAQRPVRASDVTLYVRSQQSPATIASEIRSALLAVNPNLVVRVTALKEDVADTLVAERLMAMLASFFGMLAIVLAAVGLYGVIAYSVARRTSEIGLRIALGADPIDILRLILTEVAGIAAVGALAGFALTLTVTPFARTLLFGVGSADPAMLAGSLMVVAVVALLASLVPALHAARLSPVRALAEP
jgi:predicted permease